MPGILPSLRRWLLITALAALLLLAYAIAYKLANIQSVDKSFTGLTAAFSSRAERRMIRLLFVHGIGRHCIGYADSFVATVTQRLGLYPASSNDEGILGALREHCGQDVKDANVFLRRQRALCKELNAHSGHGCQKLTLKVNHVTPQSGEPVQSPFDTGFIRTKDFFAKNTPISKSPALRLYEVIWDPATRASKTHYVHGVDDQFDRQREHYNREMKYAIVNESISDAVLYLGSYKRIMQYPLLAGFCKLLSDGISEQADAFECDLDRLSKRASPGFVNDFSRGNEIVVITHSLGTRMLFDALGLMSDPEFVEKTKTDLRDLGVVVSENEGGIEKVREIFQRSLSKVFTFANQIPLLELGNVRNPVVGLATRGQYPELGKGFSKFLEQRAGLADGPLQLVAFTDPNDLLSYNLKCWYYMNVLKFHPKIREIRAMHYKLGNRKAKEARKWFRSCDYEADLGDPQLADELWEAAEKSVKISDVSLKLEMTLPLIFADPSGAHSNYFNDERVSAMIACGGDEDADEARECATN